MEISPKYDPALSVARMVLPSSATTSNRPRAQMYISFPTSPGIEVNVNIAIPEDWRLIAIAVPREITYSIICKASKGVNGLLAFTVHFSSQVNTISFVWGLLYLWNPEGSHQRLLRYFGHAHWVHDRIGKALWEGQLYFVYLSQELRTNSSSNNFLFAYKLHNHNLTGISRVIWENWNERKEDYDCVYFSLSLSLALKVKYKRGIFGKGNPCFFFSIIGTTKSTQMDDWNVDCVI